MIKITLALMITQSLFSSFEYRENGPGELFPYTGAVEQLDSGCLSNPATLPFAPYSYIGSGYSRPYSLGELQAQTLRAGQGFDSWGLQGAWSRFGIPEYREDILEGNIGYSPASFFSAGAGFSYYHLDIGTDELSWTKSFYDGRCAFLFFLHKSITVGFAQDNLAALFQNHEDIIYPSRSAGLLIKPADGIALIWNCNQVYYGYINSFSASMNILKCLNFKAGYSRETATYAASIRFIYKNLNIFYGLRHHPYLGNTHSFGCTITSRGISLEPITYRTRIFKRKTEHTEIKKIDINTCSQEELKKIPVLSPLIAERIVKYRKLIGPVTKKSLLQLGLSENDFKELLPFVYGMAREKKGYKKSKKKYRHKKNYFKRLSHNQKTALFRQLLASGVRSSLAFRICKIAGRNTRQDLLNILRDMPDLSPEKKRLIISICKKYY